MNTERTISIRKRIHLAEGTVQTRVRQACGELIEARDISCTVSVDVPVLTEIRTHQVRVEAYCAERGWNASETTRTQALDIIDMLRRPDPDDRLRVWMEETGSGPDDEIGLLARALPVSCRFRLQDGDVWYHRADLEIAAMYNALDGSRVLGVDANGRSKIVAGDTPVVVRVCDILPDYEPSEDK